MEIAHRLPGRIRLRLSRRVHDPERLLDTVREHEGLVSIRYTPITHSVLARFEPGKIPEEEIVLRVALALGLDAGAIPVHVSTSRNAADMTLSTWLSGGFLMSAVFLKITGLAASRVNRWEWMAAITTAGAVLHHAWREFGTRGAIDPEVLSLGYLATSFRGQNLLRAAVLTWMASFGRHLLQKKSQGIIVRPVKKGPGNDSQDYEVTISPEVALSGKHHFSSFMKEMLDQVMAGVGGKDLLDDMRRLSQVHGETLEGMGWIPEGIPLKFS